MVTINSYFSGAGLMDTGIQLSGLDIQQSFEIDQAACETHRLNTNHQVVQCDITQKLAIAELPCDVMIGTYPCNKYSPIADISATRTGDDLFLHFFRHIALRQPEIYVVENVPGMRKFPVVMEALTQLPDYYVSTFCPVATETWLPQRRDRLILIGSRSPFDWREPEQGRAKSLADLLESAPDIELTESCINRLNGKYRDKPIISDPEKGDIAPTCVAHYHKDRSTRMVRDRKYKGGIRPYTVREYARLQGVPDWFKFAGTDNDAYKQIGNGVPCVMGEWVGCEIQRYFGRDKSQTYFTHQQAQLF